MEASHEFLRSLALVFSIALVSKRLKLPLVFGYIVAGMILVMSVLILPARLGLACAA